MGRLAPSRVLPIVIDVPTLRLVTWNCWSGRIDQRVAQLSHLRPDLVVLEECAQPDDQQRAVWRGPWASKGIGVVSPSGVFALEPQAIIDAGHTSALSVRVTGPLTFSLLAIWSHRPYVADVMHALDTYRDRLKDGPAIVAGDFNSSPAFDARALPGSTHLDIVRRLRDEFGLVSAYHAFHGVDHGQEPHATLYHQWKEARPFHIDYMFLPMEWLGRLRAVEVGTWEAWLGKSDHRPLAVELSVGSSASGDGANSAA